MMESKKEAIHRATFRAMDREIQKRFPFSAAFSIENSVDRALSFGNAVRSSVDTLLREKYT